MSLSAAGSRPSSGGGVQQVLETTLTTVGAVNADFDAFAPWPEGRAVTILAYFTGTNANRTGLAGAMRSRSFNRAIGGALFGTTDVAIFNNNVGLAGVAMSLNTFGNTIRVRVTGIAGQTITWRVTVTLYNVV